MAEIEIDDCWNRIGVWAKDQADCPELEAFVHCRNCRVYRAAGQRLLDRELPRQLMDERAQAYAIPKPQREMNRHSFFVFRIGGEWLALPTHSIREVIRPGPLHRIPHQARGLLEGLTSVDGHLEIVIALNTLLGISSAHGKLPNGGVARHLVLQADAGALVFRVDEAWGTCKVADDAVRSLPSTLDTALTRHTRGVIEVSGRDVGVIDLALLLRAVEQGMS
jgi:chemotaxis signal transduction protein